MERNRKYTFYIIKFLQLPYNDVDELVCVPQSWCSEVGDIGQRIRVAYPLEHLPSTRLIVKKRKKPEKAWKFYDGIIKYGTDYFSDAARFIKAKSGNSKSGIPDAKTKSADKRKSHTYKRMTPMGMHLYYDPKDSVSLSIKRILPLDFIREVNKRSKMDEIIIESASEVSNCSSTLLESVKDEELPSLHEDSSALVSRSAEITLTKSAIINAVVDHTTSHNPVNIIHQQPAPSNGENLLMTLLKEQRSPEITLERGNASNKIEQRAHPVSITENVIPSTPSNQLYQASKYPVNENPLSALKRCTPEELFKSNKPNKDDKRSYPQVNRKTNVGHGSTSTIPTNQSGWSSKYIHENQSSLRYGDHWYPDQRVQRSHERKTTKINDMVQSVWPQRSAINTSTVQNAQNLANQSCHPQQPLLNYNLPPYVNYPDPRIQGAPVQRFVGVNSIDQEAHPQSHAKNVTSAVQNTLNLANLPSQARESSQKMPLLTTQAPSLYLDPNEREIFAEISTEANSTNSRTYPRTCEQNTPTVEDMIYLQESIQNLINQYNCLSEKTQPVPVNRNYCHQDPRNRKKTDISTEINVGQRACPQDAKKNASSTSQMFTNSANTSQLSAYSQGKQYPLTQNDLFGQNLRAHTVMASRPTEMMGMNDGVPHNFKKSAPHAMQNLSNAGNTMPSYSNLANQFVQSFQHSNEAPMPPIYENYSLQVSHIQENLPSRPIEMNVVHHQGIPENIQSAVQNSSSSASNFNCSCQCLCRKNSSLNIPEISFQNPRVQESQIETVIGGNSIGQRVYHESDTEKRPSVIENLTSIAHQSSNHLVEKQLHGLVGSQNSADQEITEQISLEKSGDANHIRQSNSERVTINKPIASQSPTIEVNNKLLNSRGIAEGVLLKNFTDIFNKMHFSVSENLELLNREQSALKDHSLMLKKLMKLVERYSELKTDNAIASTSKNTTVKSKKVTNEMKNKRSREKRHNLNNDDDYEDNERANNEHDEHDEAPKENHGHRRSFVLPPEYDPKDSRWTLKHRRASPGLVEVIPRSRVYIDAIRFANCKRMSKDHRTFARMLLMEIFTKSALSVCSLTGARANAFHINDSDVRPGLDENARTVLLSCVEEFGREVGWGQYDMQSVLGSIRSKLRELRNK